MRILALDTSFNTGTIALVEGDEILAELSFYAERSHGEKSMEALEAVFSIAGAQKSSVDLIAVGTGPGGFTSVRIGIATAKGLALARDLPIVGLSSLLMLARSAAPSGGLVAAFAGAGRGEYFGALYELDAMGAGGEARALVEPLVGPEEALHEAILRAAGGREFITAGEALFADRLIPFGTSIVRASALAYEARRVFESEGQSDLDALAPLYLRDSDAKLPAERLRDPSTI